MAANNRRIVMGKSPGTGLFVHEPTQENVAPRAAKHGHAVVAASPSMAQQEEERVNGQLVDILEKKCAKLQRQLDEQTHARSSAEGKLASATTELEDLRQKVKNYEDQIRRFCSMQQAVAEERRVSAEQRASLESCEAQRDEARRAAAHKDEELRRLRDEFRQKEASWKNELTKLSGEVRVKTQHATDAQSAAQTQKKEAERLTAHAQELVRRYEQESERRLELEEKFLNLEEKTTGQDTKFRAELEVAQQKAKRASELQSNAEERYKALEVEVQQLRNQMVSHAPCANSVTPSRHRQKIEETPNSGLSRIPQPRVARPAANRPGSGQRPSSSEHVHAASAQSQPCQSSEVTVLEGQARLYMPQAAQPPGAIRRAGSVPSRRPPGGPSTVKNGYSSGSTVATGSLAGARGARPPSAGHTTCSSSSHRSLTPSTRTVAQAERGSARSKEPGHYAKRPMTSGSSPREAACDIDIDVQIPNEPDDSSDEEVDEVWTAMRAGRVE